MEVYPAVGVFDVIALEAEGGGIGVGEGEGAGVGHVVAPGIVVGGDSIALAVPPGYIPGGVAAASQYLALVLQFDYSHRWLLIFLFHCCVLLT